MDNRQIGKGNCVIERVNVYVHDKQIEVPWHVIALKVVIAFVDIPFDCTLHVLKCDSVVLLRVTDFQRGVIEYG